MCIHYLLAGVSVINEQPTSSTTIQIENDPPSTSERQRICQKNGSGDSEETPEDKARQATPQGRLIMIFLLFLSNLKIF